MSKWKPGAGTWLPELRREPARGLRRGKYALRDLSKIARLAIHHTGVGVLGRFKRQKDRFGWTDPIEAAAHVYRKIMDSAGHFVVGWDGAVIQFCPLEWAAWHAGYGNKRKRSRMVEVYRRLRFNQKSPNGRPAWFSWEKGRYLWWVKKWYATHGFRSPADWFPNLDTNGTTVGIELLSTPGRDPFTKEQLHGGPGGMGFVALVKTLAGLLQIPIDFTHILTHSDIVPTSRTTSSGKPWDPPPSKYDFDALFTGTSSTGTKTFAVSDRDDRLPN